MERIALLCTFFLLFAATTTMAQRTVSGNVMDEDGEPLIGATVQVKGTTVGAVTDIDGSYSLTVPAGRETLVFSYTGFRSVEVELGASDVVDITLASDIAQLSEVVVVGYGTQIKSTLTGNVASVEGEEIENLPVTSVEQALQGRTAGVFIQSVNGKPGGRINVRVRGSSSITASNQPLYVIDGVPITSGTFSSPGAGSQNFLADFNFNDVESVEILKDASASAIYGSRAANGVILITTKKGKVGKARVNFNYSRGFSDESGRRQFLNADEYIDLFRRTARGGAAYDWANQLDGFGLGSDYTEENNEQAYLDFVEGRFDRYSGPSEWRERETNTDWQDEAFRNGDSQTADFSISGGSEDLRYFGSLGYSEQDGILFGNDFTRFSGRLNLNGKVNERMSWGMTSSLSRTSNNRVSNDNFFSTPLQLVALSPLTPPRNTTDQVFRGFEPGQLFDRPVTTYYNGLIEEVNSRKETVTYRSLANFYSSYEFFQGFSLRGEFGVDLANIRQNRFQGRMTTAGESTNGFADSRWSEILNFNTKLFANFNREFGGVNNVDIVAGVEFQKSKSENVEVDAQEFPLDDLKTIASAADIIGGLGDLTQFSFLSYFARFNYNYKRKYLLTLSGRVDASSRFGMNNQYGFFPAIAAGYVISEEPFFASQAISFLKVRASWGQTGNASIGNFSSLGLFGAEGYAQQSGLQPIQIPNPNLTWEETQQLDVGLDFGLFDDRLTGEIDYYKKNTTDILLSVPVPGTSGFRTQLQNIGEMENEGVEFLLNSYNFVGPFRWTTSLNLAYNDNRVVRLSEGQDIIDNGGSRYMNVVMVGEAIGSFYGLEYAGVDPQNGDALFYVNQMDDNGNIINENATTNDPNAANFVILGSPIPEITAGITNSFSYKGVGLDVTLQGVSGNQLHNGAGVFMSCQGCWFDNQTRDQLRAWQQPGDQTDVPEPRFFWGNGDNGRSSRYIEDGDFLRLKTVTLSYTLPESLTTRVGIQSVRIYATGQNLVTITDYSGWDPELTTDFLADADANVFNGVDFYSAPQPRTVVFGVKLGL